MKDNDLRVKIIIFVLAFLQYANTIGHDYAWDDSIVITQNPRVKKGIKGIPDLFLKYNSDYKSDKYGYRPVVLSTLALEYSLFKEQPKVGHLMNVIYFAFLCVVMYGVMRLIFFRFTNLAPFLITLLFIAHPIHVEAVANIKSRDEIFALLFSLLSLKQFLIYQSDKKAQTLISVVAFFMLGFMSKESAFTFLAIIPLTVLYVNEGHQIKKMIKPLLYCLFLGIVCIGIFKLYTGSSLGVQSSQGAGIFYEGGIIGNSFFYTDVLSTKLANAFTVLLLYLKNFFYPLNLIYFYGTNQVPVANWHQIFVWISLVINISLIGGAIFWFKKFREINYGILFYFITISMYTHILRTLADTMADRFLFAPSLGLCIAVVFTLSKLFSVDFKTATIGSMLAREGTKGMIRLRSVSLIILLFLAFNTFSRNRVWKNDDTLITSDLPKMENCSRAHYYYADMLKKELALNFDRDKETAMIAHYRKSYAICKEAYYSYLSLGTYLCSVKRYSEGMAVFDTMLVLFPSSADAHFYLGEALAESNQLPSAIQHLEQSLRLAPEVLSTYVELSLAYSKKMEFDNALSVILKAKEKFLESRAIYETLGMVYFDKGDLDQSTKCTLELLRFGEDPQKVYGTVIGRYQLKKQDSLAAVYYNEALSKGIFRR